MNFPKNILLLFLVFLMSFFLASKTYAAGLVPCGGDSDPCTVCHLIVGIKGLVDWGMGILMALSLTALTIAGVMYIVSSGSEQMMSTAKGFISSSLTGVAIALGAWLIVNTVMLLLAAQPQLGISHTWTNFSCSTASSALKGSTTAGAGTTTGKSNTDEAAKAACREYWKDYYGNTDYDALQAALATCDTVSATSSESAIDAAKKKCREYWNEYYGNTDYDKLQEALASCDNVATATSDTKSADSTVRNKLTSAGFSVQSSGNCSNCSNSSCTCFDGMSENTADELIKVKDACGINIITGANETGHSSHNGYSFDVKANSSTAKCVYDNKGSLNISQICTDGASMSYRVSCSNYTEKSGILHIKFNN